MKKVFCILLLLVSAAMALTIVELTAPHTGPQPYPQIWQGQVDDTVWVAVPDSVTKIYMMGNEVQVCVQGDSVMWVWSASTRTVHIGAE